MSFLGETGSICVMWRNSKEQCVWWKIRNFFSLSSHGGDNYDSPVFDFSDARWCLELKVNGGSRYEPSGDVGLSLKRKDEGPPVALQFTLGIEGVDNLGKRAKVKYKFSRIHDSCYLDQFFSRRILRDHKPILVPNRSLRISCRMNIVVSSPSRGISSYQDASSQTDVDFEVSSTCTCGRQSLNKQDASIQTNEELIEAKALSEENHSLEIQDIFEEDGDEIDDDEDDKELKDNDQQPSQAKKTKRISLPTRHEDVISSMKTILSEERRADFTLKSEDHRWPVHRAILEGRSRHFATLFGGGWAETNEGDVRLDDVTGCAVDGVLHFIYAGEVPGMSVKNVHEIYAAAHGFLLWDLKHMCVEYMREEMCPEMVCDALVIAETYGGGDLKESAMQCYFLESSRIIATEKWKRLKENHPAIIAELFEETIKRERKKRRNE